MKKIIIASGFLFLAALGGYAFYWLRPDAKLETLKVVRGNIEQKVSVTGKTKARAEVSLGFQNSGKIVEVLAGIGDRVNKNDILVVLDQRELQASIKEADANVEIKQAKLQELKRGTRPEEIRIQEVKVENAEAALEDAEKNLQDRILDAYIKSDDAVRTKGDQMFSNPKGSSPQFNFSADSGIKSELELRRFSLEQTFSVWQKSLQNLQNIPDLSAKSIKAREYLTSAKDFLDLLATVLGGKSASVSLSQATLDGWRSDMSSARSNISTAIINLTAAEEKVRNVNSTLRLEEETLRLKQAGTSAEEILAAEADTKSMAAKVSNLRVQIENTSLRAPMGGLITRQDAKVGEIAGINAPLVTIISDTDLTMEANVSEVDIGRIEIKNSVQIIFDALPGQIFQGKIVFIDPAETIIDGVVNFKITVALDYSDPRLKSGLTSNLKIETLKKENVLIISQSGILENDAGTFVRKQDGGGIKEVPVKIGIRSQEGLVEILEGVSEGELVLNAGTKQK